MISRRESISRANSHLRYWLYRRRIGRPISLFRALRDWVIRYRFERNQSVQQSGQGAGR